MRSIIINILCVLLILPVSCFAETDAKKSAYLSGAAGQMSFSYVLQILFSFLIVIGFILLIAWFIKKNGRLGYGGGQVIKIKSSISLGMREKILLVEVGGSTIVVGVAPGQIRTLHVLGEGAEISQQELGGEKQGNKGFKQLIDKFSKQ